MSTATQDNLQHPEVSVCECDYRYHRFLHAIAALKDVVPFCSPTAQQFWTERARDLEANAEYWESRSKDKGRRRI